MRVCIRVIWLALLFRYTRSRRHFSFGTQRQFYGSVRFTVYIYRYSGLWRGVWMSQLQYRKWIGDILISQTFSKSGPPERGLVFIGQFCLLTLFDPSHCVVIGQWPIAKKKKSPKIQVTFCDIIITNILQTIIKQVGKEYSYIYRYRPRSRLSYRTSKKKT